MNICSFFRLTHEDFDLISTGISEVFLGEEKINYYFRGANDKNARGLLVTSYNDLHIEALKLGFIKPPPKKDSVPIGGKFCS